MDKTRTRATLSGLGVDEIALVTSHYWPEVRRGTERVVNDLATGLHVLGARPSIITAHEAASAHSVEDGVDVHRVRVLPQRFAAALGYTERLGHLPATWRLLERSRPDLIHSFGVYEAALATVTGGGASGPATVWTITGIPKRANLEGLLGRRRALRRAVESTDAIVVLSEAAKRALEWLDTPLRVIAPGVDLDRFKRTHDRSDAPTLLCTAAIDDPRKRVDLVVEAFREVRAKQPTAKLVLSARPTESAAVGVGEPGVEHRDLDSHEALVRAYSEAWATVIASKDEAFGLVAVEALACGTPVVASAGAGLVEAVGSSGAHARTFQGSDPGALALEVMAAFDLALTPGVEEACRERAARFSLERILDEHVGLYSELCLKGAEIDA